MPFIVVVDVVTPVEAFVVGAAVVEATVVATGAAANRPNPGPTPRAATEVGASAGLTVVGASFVVVAAGAELVAPAFGVVVDAPGFAVVVVAAFAAIC